MLFRSKDPMAVNTAEVNVPRRGANANEKQLEGWQKNEVRRLTLKEREQKVYSFPNEDVPNIFEQLLQRKQTHGFSKKKKKKKTQYRADQYIRNH